jgi:hypothetical protein
MSFSNIGDFKKIWNRAKIVFFVRPHPSVLPPLFFNPVSSWPGNANIGIIENG